MNATEPNDPIFVDIDLPRQSVSSEFWASQDDKLFFLIVGAAQNHPVGAVVIIF
jgi:hypothetical protein